MKRKRSKIILFAVSILIVLALCACSKSDSDAYAKSVEDFYTKLNTYDAKINVIDPNDKEADKKLLEILDDMDKEFQNFAKLEAPKNAPEAKEHAENASKCMSQAVSSYHEAFKSDKPDETALHSAKLQYDNAIIEVKNVGIALQNAK